MKWNELLLISMRRLWPNTNWNIYIYVFYDTWRMKIDRKAENILNKVKTERMTYRVSNSRTFNYIFLWKRRRRATEESEGTKSVPHCYTQQFEFVDRYMNRDRKSYTFWFHSDVDGIWSCAKDFIHIFLPSIAFLQSKCRFGECADISHIYGIDLCLFNLFARIMFPMHWIDLKGQIYVCWVQLSKRLKYAWHNSGATKCSQFQMIEWVGCESNVYTLSMMISSFHNHFHAEVDLTHEEQSKTKQKLKESDEESEREGRR